MTCNHHETINIKGKFGPHACKKVCKNCNKFITWVSLKDPIEKEKRRQEHIKRYYDNLYKLGK